MHKSGDHPFNRLSFLEIHGITHASIEQSQRGVTQYGDEEIGEKTSSRKIQNSCEEIRAGEKTGREKGSTGEKNGREEDSGEKAGGEKSSREASGKKSCWQSVREQIIHKSDETPC